MAPALVLLRANRTFRTYWTARVLSLLGDGAALVALLLYAQRLTNSGIGVAGLLLARAVARLLGPVAGALADRYDQRRLMVSCDLAQTALYAVLAILLPGYAALIVLVGVASIFQTIFTPAGQAALPSMVAQDELGRANAWLGSAVNLQVAAGPLAGGLLVAFAGTRTALGVDALSFAASAACLARIAPLRAAVEQVRRGVLSATADGLRFVLGDPVARPLVLLVLGSSTFLAVDTVTLVLLARDNLHSSAAGYGLIATAFGVGMVAVSVAMLTRDPKTHPAALLLFALTVGGVAYIGTGLAPTIVIAICFQLIAGAGNGLENIATDTLIQRRIDPTMLGRAFGLVRTAAYAATSLSTVIAGVLVDVLGARWVFIGAGAGTVAAVAALGPAIWRQRTSG